ncbi:MAG: hypothetical protein O7C75_02955, partial [Verrucomicrobia bacterium]|nr:hypothetical protein [Verrucomicrobiota bacterium]
MNDSFFRSIYFLFRAMPLVFLALALQGQQPYELRYYDSLEDHWRWQMLRELGTHNRQIVVNESGKALILKKAEDDRIILFDGLTLEFLQHPSTVDATPVRLAFGPENEILMMAQEGIYQYENDNWKELVSHEFQINPNSEMATTGDGRIWIAGNSGILEFDGKQLIEHRFGTIPSSGVQSICVGNDGALWIVVGPTGDVYRCPINEGNLCPESNWERVYESEREFVNHSVIIATRENQIWVINNHEHDGVLIYDIATRTWESQNLRALGGENFSTSLMQSHDGRVWVVGRGSLHLYDGSDWKIYKGSEYPIPDSWPVVMQDEEGFVYLLETGAGITRIDHRQRQYRTLSGLHFQAEDQDDNFWYLDVEGHVVLEDRSTLEWVMFPKSETGVDAPVAVLVLDNGHVLCAGSSSEAAAFSIYDGREWSLYRKPLFASGLSHLGIIKLQSGDVILSCQQPESEYPDIQGGMLRLSYRDGQYTVDHHDTVQAPFRPWSIAEDPVTKTIWSGSNTLERVDFGIPVQQVDYPGSNNWVDKVAVTKNQDVWIAIWGNGVFRRRDGAWENMSEDNLISDHHYSHVIALEGKEPVVATEDGIFRFDGTSWAPFTSEGLSLHRVGGTLKYSSDGSFWINTTHTDWYYRGLKKEAYPEVKKNIFKTVQCLPDTHGPDTVFRGPNHSVHSSQTATIRWRGADYWSKTPREFLTYSYRLDEEPWSLYTPATELTRTDLSDGVHTLRVRARDSDFNSDPHPAVHYFEVILPIWRQTWAQVVMGLFILLV